jgi:hypothetical protein
MTFRTASLAEKLGKRDVVDDRDGYGLVQVGGLI